MLLPRDLWRAIEVDAERRPAWRLRGEAALELVPAPAIGARPSDFGDLGEPREREELDVANTGRRLGPQRRLDAEDRRLRNAAPQRCGIPFVRIARLDPGGPVEAEGGRLVVLHVEIGAIGRRRDHLDASRDRSGGRL